MEKERERERERDEKIIVLDIPYSQKLKFGRFGKNVIKFGGSVRGRHTYMYMCIIIIYVSKKFWWIYIVDCQTAKINY